MMLVTHRGPFRFTVRDDGGFEPVRGAGGIVSALLPLVLGDDNGDRPDEPSPAKPQERRAWIAAAMSDDDRAAVQAGEAQVPGLDLTLLALDPEQHRLHYDVVSNATLWFVHHGLFDLTRSPVFDHDFREAWQGYVAVNKAFADAVVEHAQPGEVVLVHDYHLALVPGMVRARRPDVRLAHFTHTPFCGPNSIRVLPDEVAHAICASMASVPTGFHTQRWADAFRASARVVLGPDAGPDAAAPSFVAPLGPDPGSLTADAATEETRHAAAELDALVGDRALVLRSDRTDPAKNIVRGFLAFDRFLELHPEWHGRVVFVALLNGSRESLPEYIRYQQEVEDAAARVNANHATDTWDPVVVDMRDDYPQTVAAFERYDVLFVNSLKDGLNLVAKEGPVLNEADGVLLLSPEAGAYDELAPCALAVHPYDVEQNAEVLHRALTMPAEERAARATALCDAARRHTPETWLHALVEHARSEPG
jgi:trehalose 6-phosphate synthase